MKCEICSFVTDRKSRFHDHVKMHKNQRDLPCPECQKMFVTRRTLGAHRQKVHGQRTLQCEFCAYAPPTASQLREHVRVMHTHRDQKPFQCRYCDFRSATRGNCHKHMVSRHRVLVEEDTRQMVAMATAAAIIPPKWLPLPLDTTPHKWSSLDRQEFCQ